MNGMQLVRNITTPAGNIIREFENSQTGEFKRVIELYKGHPLKRKANIGAMVVTKKPGEPNKYDFIGKSVDAFTWGRGEAIKLMKELKKFCLSVKNNTFPSIKYYPEGCSARHYDKYKEVSPFSGIVVDLDKSTVNSLRLDKNNFRCKD